MNINRGVQKIDSWQQRHRSIAFIYAVIKKYGEDNGGYQAALLTYYGFLSLFPLLLVVVTVLQLWFRGDPTVQQEVSTSVGHFFPLLGQQLQRQIHGLRSAGVGLAVGLLITAYGARGAADAFRFALDNMWQVPRHKRAGFPKNIVRSLAILAAGLAGFAATAAVSAFTAALGHSVWTKVLANVLGFFILTFVLGYAYRIATSGRIRYRFMLLGAGIAAFIMQLLLSFGGLLLSHELQRLDGVYGTFAVVLGLFFWMYLLAQVVIYAAEIDTVRHFGLWPRSLSGRLRTEADKHAYKLYAQSEKYIEKETISVSFK
ncbi:MAG TPA: YhjD/YihY/BrkB family envelope integrity protein [Candidatus Saccharimonadales bacterium]|nr:YhjD/YihY/BrkB family envelope integrity protein [Candidatus Saccharimonadales bacterium]